MFQPDDKINPQPPDNNDLKIDKEKIDKEKTEENNMKNQTKR